MFIPTINNQDWMSLSAELREKIIKFLGMTKTGRIEIIGNKLVSDGVSYQDLVNAINPTNLQTILQSKETDIYKLFELLINKVSNNVPVVAADDLNVEPAIVEPETI